MRGVFFKIFARYAREWLYIVMQALDVYKFPLYALKRLKTAKNGRFGGIPEISRTGLPEIEKNGGGMPPPPFGQTPHEALLISYVIRSATELRLQLQLRSTKSN